MNTVESSTPALAAKAKIQVDQAALAAVWSKISLAEVMQNHEAFITVDAKAKLMEACDLLIKHGISSAPVRDNESGRIISMFDWRDFSAGVLIAWGAQPAAAESTEGVALFTDFLRYVPTTAVADISNHNHFYSVNIQQTLQAVLQCFGQGVHRVTIMDKKDSPIGILSQSDALKALEPLLESDLQDLGSRSLAELGIISSPPVTISGDRQLIDALRMMHDHNISSVGVVDVVSGRLIGNLSVADLKYLLSGARFGRLGLPLLACLSEIFRRKDRDNQHKSQAAVFAATENDTLQRSVSRLVLLRAHRLWIVDSAHKPVGMVSLTDILKLVTPQMKLHSLVHAHQA